MTKQQIAEKEIYIRKDENNYTDYDPTLKPIRKNYKTALRYHRELKQITQKDLAERSGVNLRMIQHYEQGVKDINTAAALTVHKLAEALECTVGDLLEI